jgi:hypothetical protein
MTTTMTNNGHVDYDTASATCWWMAYQHTQTFSKIMLLNTRNFFNIKLFIRLWIMCKTWVLHEDVCAKNDTQNSSLSYFCACACTKLYNSVSSWAYASREL